MLSHLPDILARTTPDAGPKFTPAFLSICVRTHKSEIALKVKNVLDIEKGEKVVIRHKCQSHSHAG